MYWAKALKGGLLGGLNVTVFLLLMRASGLTSLNLEMMFGSMVTERVEVAPWFLGLVIYLSLSATLGLIYGAIMERAGRQGTGIGMALGAAHAVVSGLLLPVMASFHPLITSGQMAHPGLFAVHLGTFTVVLFVVAHLIYGTIVGEIYQLKGRPKTREASLRARSRRPETVQR